MLAFASMTAGGVLRVVVFFAGGDISPPVMPDPDRASRAIIPYFGGVSKVIKAELVFLDPRVRKDDGERGRQG